MKKIQNDIFLFLLAIFGIVSFSIPLHAQEKIQLNIPIPVPGGGQITEVEDLPNYVSSFFEFAIIFMAIILSATMVVGGGVYLAAAGFTQRAEFGKNLIQRSAFSLLALLFATVIINQVNPQLLDLKLSKEIEAVPRAACCYSSTSKTYYNAFQCKEGDTIAPDQNLCLGYETEEDLTERFKGLEDRLPTDDQLVYIEGANIDIIGLEKYKQRLQPAVLTNFQAAAADLIPSGYTMLVTSAFRTKDDQYANIKKNCPPNAKKSSDCNPQTALGVSSHMTGQAIDVWGSQNGSQCILQENCLKDLNACVANKCQLAVINAMLDNDFCMLITEPWHFEFSNPIGFSSGCKKRNELLIQFPILKNDKPSS